MTDTEFLTAFESGTLSRALWTHEAHIRMAYLYLCGLPDVNLLLPLVRDRINHYNRSTGNPTGYHETITVAFLAVIADRLRTDTLHAGSWESFRDAHSDLITNGLGVLLRYYNRDTLLGYAARKGFIPPDIAPLPLPDAFATVPAQKQ